MEKPDISKTTKKVHMYIEYLEKEIQEKQKMIEGLNKANPESNIYYSTNQLNHNEKVYIPESITVFFEINNKKLEVSIKDNHFLIMGGTKIMIEPNSGNSIYIDIID